MDVMMIFDVVMIGIGIYMMAAAWGMKQKNEISPVLLAEEELIKCRNKEGFIAYIYWREIVMGAALFIYGIIRLLDKFVFMAGGMLDYILLAILLIIFFWFYKGLQDARAEFLFN